MTSSWPPFQKILVANRGEIAVRIIRAIHAVGAKAVAVYSDPDQDALHVQLSDEAYPIGRAPATESYLNIESILRAARQSGAEAVHPGYGFLSENADFAQGVGDAGLVFIGPPAEVIRLMGDKVAAKQLARENAVPVLPGYEGDDQSDAAFQREAATIGFPVMLKAVAGGGGRGMRVVDAPQDLAAAAEGARREAAAAFGDGTLFVEKLLVAPRHVEVQILADQHGNTIHLFERDCSIQRRHQKVIEEAPSPALDEHHRAEICQAAVSLATAAGYVNAGTVEFLWSEGRFYFLEMNTRIQVEHGVTEMVTGVDLVKAQIEIAAGRRLDSTQDEIKLDGHAIEARLYAEDPDKGFLPQVGRVESFWWKDRRDATRVDTALESGSEVSRFYDPLMAKFLAHGSDRNQARVELLDLLRSVHVDGLTTNLPFLVWTLTSSAFVEGSATTGWGEEWTARSRESRVPDEYVLAAAAVDLTPTEYGRQASRPQAEIGESRGVEVDLGATRVWESQSGWRVGGQGVSLAYQIGGEVHRIEGSRRPGPLWRITIDNERRYDAVHVFRPSWNEAVVRIAHQVHSFMLGHGAVADGFTLVGRDRAEYEVRRAPLISPASSDEGWQVQKSADGSGWVNAPMPGTVLKVSVAEGDRVQAHQSLLVLEAMKMEHVLEAPHEGIVRTIHPKVGDLVGGGEALIEIAAA